MQPQAEKKQPISTSKLGKHTINQCSLFRQETKEQSTFVLQIKNKGKKSQQVEKPTINMCSLLWLQARKQKLDNLL